MVTYFKSSSFSFEANNSKAEMKLEGRGKYITKIVLLRDNTFI